MEDWPGVELCTNITKKLVNVGYFPPDIRFGR